MDRDALDEALNACFFKYKGIYFHAHYTSREAVDAVEHMDIRDSDVFLVTYPKSGTVWTQQILSLIFYEGHRNGTEHVATVTRLPWIEYNVHNVDFKSRPSPRLFSTHLPYYLMPKDLRFSMGKKVTMDRDALDEALNACFFKYKGIYFHAHYTSREAVDAVEHMDIRDSDVFLVTYPKSGTVWTQQILSLIFYEGHRNGTEHVATVTRLPWIEYNVHNVDFKSRPSPRLFSTHLPYYLMPKDLRFSMGKIIYVYRNPRDAMVSSYYFYKMNPNLKYEIHWETFLELFISERVHGGSWFDHISGWHTHKEDFNILFVTYEEMKKDLRSVVLKICKFVGVNLDEKDVDIVVEKATFKNMKEDPLANYAFVPNNLLDKSKGGFLRKGIVGDWKNIMTVAQSEMFDKVYREKIGDLPIKVLWDLNEEKAS